MTKRGYQKGKGKVPKVLAKVEQEKGFRVGVGNAMDGGISGMIAQIKLIGLKVICLIFLI